MWWTLLILAVCAVATFFIATFLTRSGRTGFILSVIATALVFVFMRDATFAFPAEMTIGMIFIFGTFWFWVLMAALTIELFCFMEYEVKFWGGISILAALLLLEFFGDIKIFSYVTLHPWLTLLYIFAYFFGGAVWAGVKWNFYTSDVSKRLVEAKASFLRSKRIADGRIPTNLTQEWHSSHALKQARCCGYCPGTSEHRNHKSAILRWIGYWPWSVAWFLISDLVKRIAKEIYRLIETTLQKISDYHFKDIKDDLPTS